MPAIRVFPSRHAFVLIVGVPIGGIDGHAKPKQKSSLRTEVGIAILGLEQKYCLAGRYVIQYFTTKDFERSLKTAFLGGGQAQKRALKVKAILGSLRDADPFATVSVTNHGENRLQHCVKYDLGDGWRLVTQKTENACRFLFVGDHEDVERWLDGHKGQQIAVHGLTTVLVPGVGHEIARPHDNWVDHHLVPLVDHIDAESMDHVFDGLSRSVARKLEALDSRATISELDALVQQVVGSEKAALVHSVFTLLLTGNVEGAQAHIDLSMGRLRPLEEVDASDLVNVVDGEEVRRLRIGSPEYGAWLEAFEKKSKWHEWFLFLHPEQEKVVLSDYPGASQLSGVSGSGKTCIAVRRAIRLAAPADSKILLLTLNRSLAGLIKNLVDAVCDDGAQRARIEVTSFFELAQRLLLELEPQNKRLYSDVTWKLGEHVDEVFREYYRQWVNNSEAKVLVPVHKSITARGVSAETYLYEEFDWIRSAIPSPARRDYVTLDRKSRKFPIPADRRNDILKGLEGWERKMRQVGVIDYLGLTSALVQYAGKIGHRYTNVLVDEAQDFGTTELSIVRQLVSSGPNDIFLCGDIAQTILPKHRSLSEAGLSSITRERIQKNYRNSREILRAAYEVLKNNLHEELFDSEGLEILDPQFANFSGSVPMALAAGNLEEEIAYAVSYAATTLRGNAKTVCIAFAGFSARDVNSFARKCAVAALDGAYEPSTDRLVFCDLEQSKGYEFDTLIILNCRDGVLPPNDAPAEEAHRASCKLYVAMTRARRELILSFHDKASPWIAGVSDTIATARWGDVEILDRQFLRGVPDKLPELEPDKEFEDVGGLSGLQFLYTPHALRLSPEAQDKLIELVDGRGMRRAAGGSRLKWRDMRSLVYDLNESRRNDALFGPVVIEEIRKMMGVIKLNPAGLDPGRTG